MRTSLTLCALCSLTRRVPASSIALPWKSVVAILPHALQQMRDFDHLGYSNKLWMLGNWMDLLAAGALSDVLVDPAMHGTLYGVVVELWVGAMPSKLAGIVANVERAVEVCHELTDCLNMSI